MKPQCNEWTFIQKNQIPFTNHLNKSERIKFKMPITSLKELKNIVNDIPSIVNSFLNKKETNNDLKTVFLQNYKHLLSGEYIDIILLMINFPEFNILDYVIVQVPVLLDKILALKQWKEMNILRNNMIISIIITSYMIIKLQNQLKTLKGEDVTTLKFLEPLIDQYKNELKKEDDSDNNILIEYDVELLFFSIFQYKEISDLIMKKYYLYFYSFVSDADIITITIRDFMSSSINKKFEQLTDEEIIIYRKIINKAAIRKLNIVIQYFIEDSLTCGLMTEGKIWKNVSTYMNKDEVFRLWCLFETNLPKNENSMIETLSKEYSKKKKKLKSMLIMNKKKKSIQIKNSEQIDYEIKCLNKEIQLMLISSIFDLFIVLFRSDLRDIVLYFLKKMKDINVDRIPLELFEICLWFDEDISMYIKYN